MTEKRDPAFLLHILEAIERIFEYAADGRESFLADRKTQDAVLRNLEILGEAVKSLSPELREAHPDIPWRQIAGMRDRLIHGYFAVNLELVYGVIERDLPVLQEKVDRLANSL